MTLERLPASRQEAETLSALVLQEQRKIALNFDANRASALGEDLGQYRYLHFATEPPRQTLPCRVPKNTPALDGSQSTESALPVARRTYTRTLQLELELIPLISPRYQAELATSAGERIQHWPSLRPVSQAGAPVIRLCLPADKVAAGEYVLTLTGRNAADGASTSGKYRFSIERR